MNDDLDSIKRILSTTRLDLLQEGSSCPPDPEVAEALQAAERDQDLSRWLEEERAFDAAFAAKLAEFPVPPFLQRQIMGRLVAVAPAQTDTVVTAVAPERPQHRKGRLKRRFILSAAAALVVGFIGVKLVIPEPVKFPPGAGNVSVDTFRDHMAFFADSYFWLDDMSDDLTVSREWLEERGVPVVSSIPELIGKEKGMGCKVIDWGGREVGLICFSDSEGRLVHLFSVEREALSDNVDESALLADISIKRGRETIGWMDEHNVYVLVGSEPGVPVAPFFPGGKPSAT